MLKTVALLLLSVSLGMGGAVALTLSHGAQHERHASFPAHEPQPEMRQTSAGTQAALPASALAAPALAHPVALPDQAALVVQPDLPRLQPRPRPTLSAPALAAPALSAPALTAAIPARPARPSGTQPLPPQLSISSHSATAPLTTTPLWQPPAAPDRQPGLLHADGGINYNPWKTGVYR